MVSKIFILVFILGTIFWIGLTQETQEQSDINSSRVKRSTKPTSQRRRINLDAYKSTSEKQDNCTRLSLDRKRTKVSHEHNVSFVNLMDGGFDNMVGSTNFKDVILIMGNTGVGKSVITQIVAGDLNRIHAVKSSSGSLVIIDDSERISAPSVISRTLVPELVVATDNGSSVPFYDCPGFDDTRGPAQDVATSFFMNQIVHKVTRVKILFLVLSSSVSLGHDRIDFDSMAQHATTFVKNITEFKDSIGLVVTKVKNYSETGEYQSDDNIMRKILGFLEKYYDILEESLESLSRQNDTKTIEKIEKIKRKLEFVDILLESDANGIFSKITFSRDPEKCGPLSSSIEVGKTKQIIKKLYNSLNFSNVEGHSDSFGFSLKSETVLKITSEYISELNNGIVSRVEDLVNSFKIWYDQAKLLESTNDSNSSAITLNKAIDNETVSLGSILALNSNSTLSNQTISSIQLGKVLQNSFSQVQFPIPETFFKFLENQDAMFEFFRGAVGSEHAASRVNDWIRPLLIFRDKIASDYVPEMNNKIVENVTDIVESFQTWTNSMKYVEGLNYSLPTFASSGNMVNHSTGALDSVINFIKRNDFNNSSMASSGFGKSLKQSFSNLNFSVPEKFVHFMENQSMFFKFFQNVLGSNNSLERYNDWVNPLVKLQSKIVSDYIPEVNQNIENKVTELVNDFLVWFDNSILDVNGNYSTSTAESLSETIYQTSTLISNILALNTNKAKNNISIRSAHLSEALQFGLKSIQYSVPESFVTFMKQQDNMIDFFERAVGYNQDLRRVNNWLNPINTLQTKILEHKKWYEFCAKLQTELISLKFHEKKSRYALSSASSNWLTFVEANGIVPVGKSIEKMYDKYGSGSKQVQFLNHMISYATVPTFISCRGNTVTIKSNFIRFSEFLDNNGRIKINSPSCLAQHQKTTIEIFAGNTVFVDESLNGEGLELNFILISPKWVVSGKPILNFNGKMGSQIYPKKAASGPHAYSQGKAGYAGVAGKPGGPGGIFIGISDKIESANKLSILSNGGSGGLGQDGGDGSNGGNGREPLKADMRYADSDQHTGFTTGIYSGDWNIFSGHPGYLGGRGGDGGVGGLGGHPGYISVTSLADGSSEEVQLSLNKGETGKFGEGGKGGEGGRPGSGMKCFKGKLVIIKVREKCESFPSPLFKTANGNNGRNGHSRIGLEQPIASINMIEKKEKITKFKNLFSTILDADYAKFVDRLDSNYHMG